MKVYIAGKIWEKYEIEFVEEIAKMCEDLGFTTFLPHRDVGFCEGINDVKRVFKGDIIDGFSNCTLVIAVLEGLHVGAGTAWELGYAYSKGIPAVGIKTDETVEEALEYLSSILIASMDIVDSKERLKDWLVKFKKKNNK
jgi:nucleoside 2-deoxyribosyltransferase